MSKTTGWLEDFESIGDNCEFGFVQRALGGERSSLLRWVFIDSVDATVAAIRGEFDGMFVFENLQPAGAGAMVRDVTAGIAFHTEMKSEQKGEDWSFIDTECERRAMHAHERLKLEYLLGKFKENIAGSQRIYVVKRNTGLTRSDADAIFEAIASKGGGRLLYVTVADRLEKVGKVELIHPRMAHGWIDRFAPYNQANNVSLTHWEEILRAADHLFATQPVPVAVQPQEKAVRDFFRKILSKLKAKIKRTEKATPESHPIVKAEANNRDQQDQHAQAQTEKHVSSIESALFDPLVYEARYVAEDGCFNSNEEVTIKHWREYGMPLKIVPTSFFDEGFYLATYPDIAALGELGFAHFLDFGLREGRAPNIWFDPSWYAFQTQDETSKHYDHFLKHGVREGRSPSSLAKFVHEIFEPQIPLTLDTYAEMVQASLGWSSLVTPDSIKLLANLFVPAWHKPAASPLRAFIDYLRHGLIQGVSPGPLFDPALYAHRAAEAGLPPLAASENLVIHWLQYGVPARIIPTQRFDDAFYRSRNADISEIPDWAFLHFLRFGIAEGRIPSPQRRFRQARHFFQTTEQPIQELYRHWYAIDFPNQKAGEVDLVPASSYRRLEEVLASENLQRLFKEAQAIEPAIGELASISEFLLLPYYDPLSAIHAEAKRRIPRTNYDSIICVPWIRTGGADLVAGLLAASLLRIRPKERVLVLRTDAPHFERADWLPDAADVVDISDLTKAITEQQAQHLLRVIFRGLTAARVFNVNSRLCWTTFRSHGANLASTLHSYAYLFCWDQTASGLRVGYPSEFFSETVANITGFMTDTIFLRNELTKMYRLPDTVSKKIFPLYTPAQSGAWTPSAARQVHDASDPGSRKLVLWGGRLDRQKRFDLVQDIARCMPDVEFRCWGTALIDASPDLTGLPGNITMQGGFASFDDLPLTKAGAWLFTSAWEGMPTTLIELATRGVAVVASAVGGVPELITDETGWAVPPDGDASQYVSVLKEVLQNQTEAMRRAEALQGRVLAIYSQANYDAALDAVLAREEPK
ncbi:glycosyltransferase family 4 protein [Acidisoma cellulosilytica]|uniref:Glycosyltransferase family 4 protein n=1 Tax=Acidisoma cellulosilyticum TaxID=2802395 RepID=A0A963Z6V8_9PROT|nr:glycosyltransferase family 4 protein [Acidisoma cellulosilyticum]MCB8883912.1 glycosyltransferase family 4 protein [Acidisoma cellulosilyticum]